MRLRRILSCAQATVYRRGSELFVALVIWWSQSTGVDSKLRAAMSSVTAAASATSPAIRRVLVVGAGLTGSALTRMLREDPRVTSGELG